VLDGCGGFVGLGLSGVSFGFGLVGLGVIDTARVIVLDGEGVGVEDCVFVGLGLGVTEAEVAVNVGVEVPSLPSTKVDVTVGDSSTGEGSSRGSGKTPS
jgi:hypothetical protein